MSTQSLLSPNHDLSTLIDESVIRRFQDDGVVLLKQALHRDWLQLIEMGLGRVLGDGSVAKHRFFAGQNGELQETVRNFDSAIEIRRLMFDSPLADMLGLCMQSAGVWYYSDEFFIKDAGGCERTPWHQDTPYFPVAGKQLASVWISLDRLRADECLEFVRGTHRSTMYDGFDPRNPGDPAQSYYKEGLPKLPDIQANRSAFPIVSWDIEPGDIIISSPRSLSDLSDRREPSGRARTVFHDFEVHSGTMRREIGGKWTARPTGAVDQSQVRQAPSTIHGGGPTLVDGRRRAIAIRMFGDDVVFATRPPSMPTVPLTLRSLRGRSSTGCGGATSARFSVRFRCVAPNTRLKRTKNRTRIDTRLAPPPSAAQTPSLAQHLRPGDPLRSPWYPQLRPVPSGERYGV